MTPELKEQKKNHVRVVFDGAIRLLDTGERDAAFDSLHKLLGMKAAFHLIDEDLHQFAKLAADALIQYEQAKHTTAPVAPPLDAFMGGLDALRFGDVETLSFFRRQLFDLAVKHSCSQARLLYRVLVAMVLCHHGRRIPDNVLGPLLNNSNEGRAVREAS